MFDALLFLSVIEFEEVLLLDESVTLFALSCDSMWLKLLSLSLLVTYLLFGAPAL